MSEDQKTMFKLCGLWKQQGKGEEGKTYYSGSLSYSTNLLLFPNRYKESPDDKQPDLILYIAKKEKKPKPTDEGEETGSKDEVPF